MFRKTKCSLFLSVVLAVCLQLSACTNQGRVSTEQTAPAETTEGSTESVQNDRVLSQEELDNWSAWFHEDWYFPGGFLRSEYDDVRDADFSRLLYNGLAESVGTNGPFYPPIAEKEMAELIKIDPWAAEFESRKIPDSLLNEKLLQYTGLTLSEFSALNLDTFFRLDQYDAYYKTTSDPLDTRAMITAGVEKPDGALLLDWEIEVEFATGTVTLQKHDGRYVITANRFH